MTAADTVIATNSKVAIRTETPLFLLNLMLGRVEKWPPALYRLRTSDSSEQACPSYVASVISSWGSVFAAVATEFVHSKSNQYSVAWLREIATVTVSWIEPAVATTFV